MDSKAFVNSPAGKLVKTRIHLTPYWAFVPNPLPPEVMSGWKLTGLISEADRAISELAGVGRTIPDPAILIEPFMRREAVLSSRIEGTHTGLEELLGFESGHQIPGFRSNNSSKLESQEVLNYVKALKAGMEWIRRKPLNLALLKEMNKILLFGVRGDEYKAGEFREIQNFVGQTNNPEDAIFIPPPVEELSGILKSFENYLISGNQYPPLVRLALIHYQFEAIHPFLDGNGRVGRLLIGLILVAWGLLPSPLLYLSAFFEHHRDDYYRELLFVSQKGSWEDWITFFLNAVITQSKDALKRSGGLIDLRENWRFILNNKKATSFYYTIVDSLFEKPYISVSDIEKLLKVTNRAARNMVSRLQQFGILEITQEKLYGRVYEAQGILQILQSD
ncbi:MAG: Fic family protein [Anaerolineaceae bacterium]